MSVWRKNNSDQSIKKSWSLDEAKEKLSTFCAYQERCIWEIRRKLYEKGIKDSNTDVLVDYLIQENFVNEERYAKSFARGKFRMKKWGRGRISRELKMRQINEADIRKGLSEIDPVEYYDSLLSQVEKHWERIKESDPYKKKYKLIQYLFSKGFEQDLIKDAISDLGFEN
ncbi:regulatory protein RecX [Algoriphagus sp. SE2]|uniref:regulatory protein RecX n=1 Tax=Algoriphagus sp. SE2 TaxID=3141536 RepID=UPI0031CD0B21